MPEAEKPEVAVRTMNLTGYAGTETLIFHLIFHLISSYCFGAGGIR
jgi:hypothetical protein